MRQLLITLTILLTGCDYINPEKRRADKAESYKIFFQENKGTFEQLTREIQNDGRLNNKNGLFQKVDDLDDLKKKKFQRFEIHTFSISRTDCGQPEIEYMTSWTDYPIGQTYLTKGCPDEKSEKGNYWKGGFIEVWGLGDGWILWIDSDPI